MPSYISYKNNLKAILDANDTEIESWITVRGNHIPIKKGQSKEDAVKSFIESKGGEYKKESYGKYYVKYGEGENKKYASPRNDLIYRDKSKAGFFGSEKEAKEYAKKLNHTDPYAGTEFAMKNYKRTVLPYEVESEPESSKKDFYSAGMELAKSLNIDKGRMKDYLEYQKNNSLVKSNTPQDAIKALKNYIKEVNSGNIDDDWELFEDKDPKQVLSELNKIEKESKYDPEFEVVRKNALANGSVYGGKYTQKSKAEAYKEYKNDISSKENLKKANEFVNGTTQKQESKTDTYTYKKGEEVEFYTDVMHDDLAKGKIIGFERSMASHGNKAENQYIIKMPDGSTRTINEKQIDWAKERKED